MKYALIVDFNYQKYFQEIIDILMENLPGEKIISNKIDLNCKNIAFGTHNKSSLWDNLPEDSIIVNLEQLHDGAPCLTDYYWNILKKYTVWDYSQSNVEYLLKKEIFAERIIIGWSEKALFENIIIQQDIDVLFLGWLNERRLKVYNDLIIHPKLKNKKIVFKNGIWGKEKEELIKRSKIVLNIHFYGEKILETLRIFPLLANEKLVISEKSFYFPENDEWEKGLVLCKLNEIVEKVIYYLENPNISKRRATEGKNFFLNKKVSLPTIRKEIPKIIDTDFYHYYPEKDSLGSDIFYYPEKDIYKLNKIIKQNKEIIAFNNLGFFKTRINEVHTKKEIVLYIKPLDITFTITSCKRINHFISTMENFLEKCKDHYLIKNWICIDDNSTEKDRKIMAEKYPFFRFIFKTPDEKGHAKSMNIINKIVKTKFVLQYEDDWQLESNLWIQDLYSELESSNNLIQIKLLNQHETPIYGQNKGFISVERFNPLLKNKLNDMFKKEILELSKETYYYELIKNEYYQNGGYWWPGFTLNPSLYNLDLLKKITPWEERKEFEFLQGVKIFFKGYKIKVWTNCRCLHLGNDISAYDLNGFSRNN
jgi:hypothetical protein